MATAMCCRDIQMEASFEQSILRVHCWAGAGRGGGRRLDRREAWRGRLGNPYSS